MKEKVERKKEKRSKNAGCIASRGCCCMKAGALPTSFLRAHYFSASEVPSVSNRTDSSSSSSIGDSKRPEWGVNELHVVPRSNERPEFETFFAWKKERTLLHPLTLLIASFFHTHTHTHTHTLVFLSSLSHTHTLFFVRNSLSLLKTWRKLSQKSEQQLLSSTLSRSHTNSFSLSLFFSLEREWRLKSVTWQCQYFSSRRVLYFPYNHQHQRPQSLSVLLSLT